MPQDRTPHGEDLIHGTPPDAAIPEPEGGFAGDSEHRRDRAAAARQTQDEIDMRPDIPAPGRTAANDAREHPAALPGAPLDGKS